MTQSINSVVLSLMLTGVCSGCALCGGQVQRKGMWERKTLLDSPHPPGPKTGPALCSICLCGLAISIAEAMKWRWSKLMIWS